MPGSTAFATLSINIGLYKQGVRYVSDPGKIIFYEGKIWMLPFQIILH